VLGFGDVNGRHVFIDMELCGINLHEYIKEARSETKTKYPCFIQNVSHAMSAAQIWNIMRQIASGVAFIHSLDEVHRDLKPKNSLSPRVLTDP
jgi:serine/threonine protein kinase